MTTVSQCWRYPVKSFQGERVDRLVLGADGFDGDRRYAVVAAETGHLLSAKIEDRLFEATARTVGDEVVVVLGDGTEFEMGASDAATHIGRWLDREVTVAELGATSPGADAATSYDMTLDPPNDDAEVYEIPTPPGTFLDLAAVHLITTATLARFAEARPDLVWDVRRFRPNVVVDLDGPGFPEDEWVGHDVVVGGAVINGMMRTMRCAMPLRAQPAATEVGSPALERNVDIYRALQAVHANDLGLYASVVTPGTIAVGDAVTVPVSVS